MRTGILLAVLGTACAGAPSEHALPAAASGTGTLTLGKDALHYEVSSSGEALVLINGGAMDLRQWDAQAQAFAGEFQVIRYDARGWGRSPLPSESYSQWDDLRALLDHLGVERAHVLGQSYGGSIAIDFALMYPERVRSLVLVGPALGGFAWSADFLARNRRLLEAGSRTRVEQVLEDPHFLPGARANAALASRAKELLRSNAQIFEIPVVLAAWLEPPAIERLEEIRAPTLVLVPELDHPDLFAVADVLQARLADCERRVLPGVGQMAHLEDPEMFNQTVLDFLRLQRGAAR